MNENLKLHLIETSLDKEAGLIAGTSALVRGLGRGAAKKLAKVSQPVQKGSVQHVGPGAFKNVHTGKTYPTSTRAATSRLQEQNFARNQAAFKAQGGQSGVKGETLRSILGKSSKHKAAAVRNRNLAIGGLAVGSGGVAYGATADQDYSKAASFDEYVNKYAERTGATVGAAIGGGIGGAIGAKKGKRLQTAAGSMAGSVLGTTLGSLASVVSKGKITPQVGWLAGSSAGSAGGAYLLHGKDKKKKAK